MAILRLVARIWIIVLGVVLVCIFGGLAARWLLPLLRPVQAPTISAITPASGISDVPLRAEVRLRFSQPMNRRSVERHLRVEPAVPGRFHWDDLRREVIFEPATPLAADETYTIGIEQGVVSDWYAPLEAPFTASFHTTPAPVVLTALPNQTNTPTDSSIALIFSRPMVAPEDLHKLVAIPQLSFEPPLPGEARWIDQKTLLFSPSHALPGATTVRGQIDGALTDVRGTPLGQSFEWNFATDAPTLIANSPLPGQRDVGQQTPLVMAFSQQIALDEIKRGLSISPSIDGSLTTTISGTGQIAVFTPTNGWQADTSYTVALDALKPVSGDRSLAPNRWSFTTAPPLTLVGRFPGQGQTLPNGQSVRLIFASSVNTDTLLAGLHLEPDAGPLRIVGSGAEVRVQAALQASTVYTLTLDQTITDRTGSSLDKIYRLNFITAPAPPDLRLPELRGRFLRAPADTIASLQIERTNLTALSFELYRLDEATLVRLFGFTALNWRDFQPERYALPLARSWRVELNDDPPGQKVTSTFDISAQEQPSPLPAGAYYVRLRSPEGPQTDLVVLVSRATLSLLSGTHQLLVWANDANGTPLADLPLVVYAGTSVVSRGRTDANGLLLVERSSGSGRYLVVAESNQPPDAAGAGAIVSSDWTLTGTAGVGAERADYRLAISTDRSTYTSDDTIQIGGFVRAISNGQIAVPTLNTMLELSMRRIGTTDIITRANVRLDRSGVVSASLQLANLAPGSYLLRAAVGDTVRDMPLRVAQAIRQPFHVQVDANAKSAEISATTLQGEPVSNAQVAWQINGSPIATPLPASVPDGAIVGDDEEALAATIDLQGSGTTDEQGRFTLALPTDALTQTSQLRISVQVSEAGGLVSEQSATLIAPASDLMIALRPASQVALARSAPPIEVTSLQIDGSPLVNTALQVDVFRRIWEPSFVETYVQRRTITTDEQGRATLALDLRVGGEYRVVVTGRDPSGRVARSASTIWLAPTPGSDVVGWRPTPGGLLLVADQPMYAPGTTANLLVGAPQTANQALVAIEQNGVLTGTVRTLSNLLDIALPDAGDANVAVLLPDSSGSLGRTTLHVQRPADALYITVASAVHDGQQGNALTQTATLTITVRDGQNIPVNSYLLAAVSPDTSATLELLSLGELTRSLRATQPALARTSGIAPISSTNALMTRPGMIIRPQPAEERMAVFWRSGLRTGPDGVVTLDVPLPPGVARWRIDVVASSDATLLGRATSSLTTTQPLVVQPLVPASTHTGDQIGIGLLAHNSSTQPLTFTATLLTPNLDAAQPASQELLLPAQASQTLRWPVRVGATTSQFITFTLQTENGFTQILTTTTTILPNRTYIEDHTQVGSARFTRTITDGLEGTPLRLELALAPSYTAAIEQSMAQIHAQKERSIEQQASLLALSSFAQQTSAISQTGALRKSLDRIGMSLVTQQHADGGWGWWADGPSDPFMTGYVLEMATYDQGVRIDAAARERALTYLLQQARSTIDSNLHAYLLYVLTLYGQDQTDAARALLQDTAAHPLEADGLAYLALMLPPEGTSEVLDRLTAMAQREQKPLETADEVFWDAQTASALPRSQTSITALVVRAFERGRPDSPLVASAQRTLARAWSVAGWPTSYDSARAADALRELQADAPTQVFSVTATLNSRPIPFPRGTLTTTAHVALPLSAPTSVLSVEVSGESADLPLLASRLTRSAPAPWLGNAPDMALTRSYLDPVSNNLLDLNDLRQGQLVRVQLTVVVAQPRAFMTLHEPRSAALDPLRVQPDASFTSVSLDEIEIRWNATNLEAGIYTQSYLARIGQAGIYALPAPSIASDFDPVEQALGPSQRAVILNLP